MAGIFKAAGYLSTTNYLQRAKSEHIATLPIHGVPWTEDLDLGFKGCVRSSVRGKGAARQSAPLDVSAVLSLGLDETPLVPDGPMCPANFVVAGTHFLCREVEINQADVSHVSFDESKSKVSWILPATKTDIRALGTVRSWGCT